MSYRLFCCLHLSVWAIAGRELGTLSIRVHNSLTVHANLWALKFDNFSEFQNVISDSPPPPPTPIPQRHYDVLRTKIVKWLTPKYFCWNLFKDDTVVSDFSDCCFGSLENKNILTIERRKHLTQAATQRCLSTLRLAAIIKIIQKYLWRSQI